MLTTKGAAAISKVQSGSGKLTITKVVASEQYVLESTLREVNSLSVENLPLTVIDRHEVPDGGSVIQVQLNNLDLNNSFIFNEIGVFATHSDNPSEEFLYIIAQVDTGTGDRIPLYSATPITATYDIYLYNVGADNIEVTISSSGLVTYEALNEACRMVKRSTSYAVGDIRYSSSLPIPYYLRCKVAGKTSSSSIVVPSNIKEEDTITDGTVVWEVIKLVSTDELQMRKWKEGHFENLFVDNGNIAGRNLANDGAMLDTHGVEITNLQSQVTTLEHAHEVEIPNLQSQVTTLEHAYAGPLVARTVAEMTDTTKVYVYTGNEEGHQYSHWYYYNGSAWADGGVYNAVAIETDKTLSISGEAADAKVVGDIVAFNKVLSDTADANTGNRIDVEINRAVTAEQTNASSIENLQADVETLSLKLADSVKLKPVPILSQSDENIDDEFDSNIQGDIFLPVTDETLSKVGYPAESLAVKEAINAVQLDLDAEKEKIGYTFNSQYSKYPIPILYLYDDGSMAQLVSKASGTLKDSVRYNFPQFGIAGTLSKVKVQGSSSQWYPKKNYTLTFENKFNAGWGLQKKYAIKANWVDFSHARNVVCAKLWGDVRRTSIKSDDLMTDQVGNYITDQNENKILTEADPMLSVGLNMGAIDGFPIAVVINNVYWGLYSFTIPKDGWMAKMNDGDREAIVSAELHNVTTQFKALAAVDSDGNLTGQDFSMEYCKDEDNQSWIATSLNQMIQAVMNSTGSNYKSTCGEHIDIDSAIDYYIFNCLINNTDGLDKNYLLDTFDGVKWYFAAYDMDGVLGNNWDGRSYLSPDGGCTFRAYQDNHRLMHLIYTYDTSRLCARYRSLRNGALSEVNVTQKIMNYCVNISKGNHDYEVLRWPEIPGTDTNTHEQILSWYRLRCIALDAEITALESAL
jgi:hypothetical protein